ncbi:MAG: beta-lactamase family protein [Proteobacteria bacterium]|nr:beta-lactamase family protein [Pseudomonadota bacterium]
MKSLSAAVTLIAVLGAAQAAPEREGFDGARLARIDKVIGGYVRRGELAGASVLVARHGHIVYLKAFGERDAERHRPMTPDTIVRFYSMSKPITAAAAMIAYEDGDFLPADPVAKYVPELAHLNVYRSGSGDQIVATPAQQTMTIEQLLTHTSGLSYSFQPVPVAPLYAKAGLASGNWYQNPQIKGLSDFAARLATVPLQYEPGEQWHYGMSLDVMALVIERTSGMPFQEFVRRRLLKPLGMRDTDFLVAPGKADRFASLYLWRDGKRVLGEDGQSSPFLKAPYAYTGSGGLLGTITDYWRFAQMLCNEGELNGVRILSPAAVDLMMRDHLRPDQHGELRKSAWFGTGGSGGGLGFGYGGAVVTDPGQNGTLGSAGEYSWGGAASTTFIVDRKEDIVAVLVTQLLPSGTFPLRDTLKTLVYQALLHPEK